MLFKAFLTALSAYSAIPANVREWDDRAMKYSLMFFPCVGAIIGAALYVWMLASHALAVSPFFFAVIAVCIPLFVTGGIHVDGYMDTVDAVSSHQSRERKLEILKDSHPGAFAVIWLMIYLLICTALYYELWTHAAARDAANAAANAAANSAANAVANAAANTVANAAANTVVSEDSILSVIPVFVLSRALSTINVCTLPNARGGGMLYSYTKDLIRRRSLYVMLAVTAASVTVMILTGGIVGIMSAAAAGVSFFLYRGFAVRTFGGTTGDTAGFFLQVCEGACLFGVWVGMLITLR